MLEQSGWPQFKDDLIQFYDLVSGDGERKNRKAHSERGALRSGEGAPDQMALRQKVLEERQRMDDMEARGEYTTDLRQSKKMFEYWKEKMQKMAKEHPALLQAIENMIAAVHEEKPSGGAGSFTSSL